MPIKAQILEAQPEKVVVRIESVLEKLGTKNEMHRFLEVDSKVYLPHKKAVTAWFLGDLMSGRKKRKYPLWTALITVACIGVLAADVLTAARG